MNSPTEQFRAAISFEIDNRKNISQAKLADETKTPRSYLNDFLKGRAPGKEDYRVLWCDAIGRTYEDMLSLGRWILDGNDPAEWKIFPKHLADKYPSELTEEEQTELAEYMEPRFKEWLKKSIPAEAQNLSEHAKTASDFTSIPKYKARLSGGHGSFEVSDQIEANLSFRTDFIKKKGNPSDMALFEVMGDSMETFIYDGDVVLVDLAQNDPQQIVDGKAYAFREGHTVKVKRLSLQGNNLIATSEDSDRYPPYKVETENFQLIGRVIWVGHEVN